MKNYNSKFKIIFTFLWFVLFWLFPLFPASAAPTGEITSFPSSVAILESFDIRVSLSNLTPSEKYHIKARLGVSTNSLTKAETYNNDNEPPDNWLSDNDAWIKFPQITADNAGTWSGTLTARTVASAEPGTNYLKVYFRKVGSKTNYKTEAVAINLLPAPTETPTPIPTNTPLPTPQPTATPKSPTKTPTPLVTESVIESTQNRKAKQQNYEDERSIGASDFSSDDQNKFDYLDRIFSEATESGLASASSSPTATPSAQLRSMMSKLFLFLGVLSLIAMVASTVYVDRKKIKQEKLQKKIPTEKTTNKV